MAASESVIEIGSTGVRLLIAEVSADRKQTVLDRSEKALPLGRDVFTTGSISRDTQNLCIEILKRYREQLLGWGIQPSETSIFATNAFREANNSDAVLDRILVQTGFKVKIVDGIEENKLMYLAVKDCIKDEPVDIKKDNTVILVVGGGTTELMMISNGKMAGVHSLKLGTVRIEQQMNSMSTSYDDMQRYVQETIKNTKGSLESELSLSDVKQFIAVGPDTTLAAMLAGHPISTFLWAIERDDFDKFVKDVQDYSIDECVARFKISYNEAETLQVSLLIYDLFIHLTKVKTILVPETNIRNGYILSKISTENEEIQQEFNMQINASARNLLRKYHGDEVHAECVRMVSLKIYDVLRTELAFDEHARSLLEVAAILHDIGIFICSDNHNLHSYYIIHNSEIFGLSRSDKTIVSAIAKFHRGKLMPQDYDEFQLLPRSERMMILKLTSILRIADALDRGHIQKFSDFSLRLQRDVLFIHTKNAKNTVLEKIALTEKASMFESVFGYKIILS